MRVPYWVAIIASATLLTGSAAAVLGTQRSAEPNDTRSTAGKNDRNPLRIQESQVRQPAAPAASAPQRVETIKYDSWVVVCEDSVGGAGKKTCSASLRAMSGDGRQMLLNWQIGVDKDGHFVTTFHVPPTMAEKRGDATVGGPLLVQNGMELKFGNGAGRRINYVWCGPQQCVAEALIDDTFVKEALANSNAVITVYTLGGGAIPIELPIKGIDKAISSTRK
jgi:invasion protein IalB